jgi:hypothetical protein
MAFYRSNSDHDTKIHDAKITKAQTELANLVQLAAEAENDFTAATEASDRKALDGADKATMKVAGDAVRDAAALIVSRNGAVESKKAELAVLIAARDAAVDVKTRLATGDEIEAKLRESGEIQRDLEAILIRLAAFADWCAPFVPEMQGLQNYCTASRAQIPEALKMAQKLVGYHAQNVLNGTAPASLKRKDAPVVQPVKPPPILTTIFAVRSLKWTDPVDGKVRYSQRMKDCSLPPALARIAVDHKAAVRLDDPRCKDRNSVGGNPEPKYCFDLDEALAAKNAGPRLVEPIKHSAPQFIESVGPARKASIAT